jgi:hypothetical protein
MRFSGQQKLLESMRRFIVDWAFNIALRVDARRDPPDKGASQGGK